MFWPDYFIRTQENDILKINLVIFKNAAKVICQQLHSNKKL